MWDQLLNERTHHKRHKSVDETGTEATLGDLLESAEVAVAKEFRAVAAKNVIAKPIGREQMRY